jgi:hypothetical protein
MAGITILESSNVSDLKEPSCALARAERIMRIVDMCALPLGSSLSWVGVWQSFDMACCFSCYFFLAGVNRKGASVLILLGKLQAVMKKIFIVHSFIYVITCS